MQSFGRTVVTLGVFICVFMALAAMYCFNTYFATHWKFRRRMLEIWTLDLIAGFDWNQHFSTDSPCQYGQRASETQNSNYPIWASESGQEQTTRMHGRRFGRRRN